MSCHPDIPKFDTDAYFYPKSVTKAAGARPVHLNLRHCSAFLFRTVAE